MTTSKAAALRLAPVAETNKKSNRILSTTQYTAIAGSLRNVLNKIGPDKITSRGFLAAIRTETSVFHENEEDQSEFPISAKRLAESAGVDRSTITRDLAAITAFAAATGLWLHAWKSGGKDFEADETIPNTFQWPSPLGRLLEAAYKQLQDIITAKHKLTKRQRKYHIETILHEEITKIIGSEKMRQLVRAKCQEQAERKANREAETKAERAERITENKIKSMPEDVEQEKFFRQKCEELVGILKGLANQGFNVPMEFREWAAKNAGMEL